MKQGIFLTAFPYIERRCLKNKIQEVPKNELWRIALLLIGIQQGDLKGAIEGFSEVKLSTF